MPVLEYLLPTGYDLNSSLSWRIITDYYFYCCIFSGRHVQVSLPILRLSQGGTVRQMSFSFYCSSHFPKWNNARAGWFKPTRRYNNQRVNFRLVAERRQIISVKGMRPSCVNTDGFQNFLFITAARPSFAERSHTQKSESQRHRTQN